MELFKNIRIKIGESILRNKIARIKRKIHYTDFNHVTSIGIVWDASNPDEFMHLSRFHQKMLERKIEISVMGYYPEKELPDKYTAIRYMNFIRKKELSFFHIPVSADSDAFINKKFDLLIDINFRKLLPLRYISWLSDSALKVGLYEEETTESPFDLMMEIKTPVDVENYLSQVIQYLEMINSGNIKSAKKN
jgi:hypothetical protein